MWLVDYFDAALGSMTPLRFASASRSGIGCYQAVAATNGTWEITPPLNMTGWTRMLTMKLKRD
jgi:hypothetical protein